MALAFAASGLGLPDVIATGPAFASATAAGSTVTVAFSNTDGGISMSGTALCCIAGSCAGTPEGCCPPSPRHTSKANQSVTSDGGVPFEVLDGRTGEYVLAAKTTVSSDGKGILLEAPAGVSPVGVRYCEQGYPQCVVRNGAGMPAMPFLANVTSLQEV